jgi:hypothetical protein
MSQVKVRNGSIVEDTYTNSSEASEATEVYLWSRIAKDMAYSFKNSLSGSDEDLNEYIEFLKNLNVNGQALGAIQAKATDFTTDDYLKASGLGTAISLTSASDTEISIIQKGSLVDDLSESNRNLVNENDLQVPITPDGEAMPLLVASNERVEGVHSLEDAKEAWEKFVSHLSLEIDDSEPTVEESSDNETSDDGDSDQSDNPLNDPTWIEGVGSATVEKFESNGYEIVATEEVYKHFESDRYDETVEENTSEGGMPSVEKIIELQESGWSKAEIMEFYGE